VAFFAVRAIRQFWLPKMGKRAGSLLAAAVMVLMTISGLLITIAVPAPLLAGEASARLGIVLPKDYAGVLNWLEGRVSSTDIVLAAEVPGAWIPASAGARVVYGHPFETLRAEEKLAAVEAWYALPAGEACRALLDDYGVRYVLFGPLEAEYGDGGCVSGLQAVTRIGDVTVYAVPQS
jgi:uncharacterized membrane protein